MSPRGGRQRIPRPPTARPGRPSPWAHLPPGERRLSLADLRARLADLPPPREAPIVAPGSRDAAVLIPLFEEAGEARVVLTKRPDTMPSHQGEIAFPGGKVDEADAGPVEAALRETDEEIGVPASAVEVVAELDRFGTIGSRFVLIPIVGFLAGRPVYSPDPVEVVKVFDVALSELMADGVHHEEEWEVGIPGIRDIQFFTLDDETIWGATGRILTHFLTHLVASR